jgi:L-fuconolactonase
MRALAGYENVWCKVSGLLTEAGPSWQPHDIRPYVTHAVAVFGRQRVMFGSDWPVLTLAGGFQQWLAITEAITAEWSSREKQGFYHDNAGSCYGF